MENLTLEEALPKLAGFAELNVDIVATTLAVDIFNKWTVNCFDEEGQCILTPSDSESGFADYNTPMGAVLAALEKLEALRQG